MCFANQKDIFTEQAAADQASGTSSSADSTMVIHTDSEDPNYTGYGTGGKTTARGILPNIAKNLGGEAGSGPAGLGAFALQQLTRIGVGSIKHREDQSINQYGGVTITPPTGLVAPGATKSPSELFGTPSPTPLYIGKPKGGVRGG